MDLSKAFDTADHVIVIKKLDQCSVKARNLWFMINAIISCGVPHGSILGPLLSLLYVNYLPNASSVLDPKMYVDNTNLLSSNNDIETLFSTVNTEFEKISEWFKANKLSMNIKKTNYTLFYKNSIKKGLNQT